MMISRIASRARWRAFVLPIGLAAVWTPPASAQTTHLVDNLGNCAGLTPCHATIGSAVAAAEASSFIQVFPGVYRETVVFGAGKNDVVLEARTKALMPVIAGSGGAAVVLEVPGVQLRNLRLEAGSGSGLSVWTNGFAGATRAVIDGCWLKGGIGLQGCADSTVVNSRISEGGIDVLVQSAGCRFEGNRIESGSIVITHGDFGAFNHVVRRNVIRGGDIVVPTSRMGSNVFELNRVEGGRILLLGLGTLQDNFVRQNVVRRGGIVFGMGARDGGLGPNTVEANFVSGSPGDGISVVSRFGGDLVVRRNTAIESAGCDINDTAPGGDLSNTWKNNRFETRCGSATE
jgi:hypothetical protein